MKKALFEKIRKIDCPIYVKIVYQTKHSCGEIKISATFFVEMYKKITRLLKSVKIDDIAVYNRNSFITYHHFSKEPYLEDCYYYLKGNFVS